MEDQKRYLNPSLTLNVVLFFAIAIIFTLLTFLLIKILPYSAKRAVNSNLAEFLFQNAIIFTSAYGNVKLGRFLTGRSYSNPPRTEPWKFGAAGCAFASFFYLLEVIMIHFGADPSQF